MHAMRLAKGVLGLSTINVSPAITPFIIIRTNPVYIAQLPNSEMILLKAASNVPPTANIVQEECQTSVYLATSLFPT